MNILRFNLISPIYYVSQADIDPFAYREEKGEILFCFELDESQRLSFEPDRKVFLGSLVFSGKAVVGRTKETGGEGDFSELPAGHYLFAQKRELLKRDDIINMAIEIQAEGLWQRLKTGKRLYLRYLFEDGSVVTQLFRPYTD
jgi:hypothetical protein